MNRESETQLQVSKNSIQYMRAVIKPRKHETMVERWFIVGPPSMSNDEPTLGERLMYAAGELIEFQMSSVTVSVSKQ